ncbi:HAD family hydrolase [Neptunomonas phycophila]|uniref:HAD family hydrolase n=1 Tax=Neptunomonas phycophila TaxID=1572645 RepID=UPI001BE95B3B|nr:HAD family hydrolase [Neptunomonas phycophila]MBT3144637.1 HAD family hydrolase [Neptunomonas phycophila]
MIKCITFDLDDTLWAVDPVIEVANERLFSWMQANAPLFVERHSVEDIKGRLRTKVVEASPHIAHSVTQVRLAALEAGFLEAGYPKEQVVDLVEASFRVFYDARQEVSFFEHALSMVEGLKKEGYQVGAISNGNASIYKVGLGHCMDFQLNADEAGVEKPHPDIFEQVLAAQNLRPEQVIHIGDNPVADVQGAAEVGMWTIWVNLKGEKWPGGPKATADVTCLSQISAAVASINQRRRACL